MELKTVTINHDHTEDEVKDMARAAFTDLEKQGVTLQPIDNVEDAGVYSEVLKDQKRFYRYIRQFDIQTGITKGRIDINYTKPGE